MPARKRSAEKPTFRTALKRRRCLIPADGFYEWQQMSGDQPRKKKPYYIHRPDRCAVCLCRLVGKVDAAIERTLP